VPYFSQSVIEKISTGRKYSLLIFSNKFPTPSAQVSLLEHSFVGAREKIPSFSRPLTRLIRFLRINFLGCFYGVPHAGMIYFQRVSCTLKFRARYIFLSFASTPGSAFFAVCFAASSWHSRSSAARAYSPASRARRAPSAISLSIHFTSASCAVKF